LQVTNHKKKRFDGKVVLITGASSGIGRQTAIDFASHGSRTVILVARSKLQLAELEKSLRGNFNPEAALAYPCDIANKSDVKRMGNEILGSFGQVDILVNNAGFGVYDNVQNICIEDIELMTSTNYLGMVYCTKAFLNSMLKRRSGHIVNVASVAASFGVAGLSAYCATKYAMLGFSESLYHELHETGVAVTVVSPIAVKATNFFNNESFKRHVPNYTGFALRPEAVSKAILDAARSHRLEIIIPFYVRAGIWFKHTLPYIFNPLFGMHFRNQLQKSKNQG
jgi:hypothetical protein